MARTRSALVGQIARTTKKLGRVEEAVRKAVLESLEESAEIVRDDAKNRVKVRTGELRDNIVVKKSSGFFTEQEIYVVADRPYGHLVEFGTQRHEQPNLGRPHPGARAQPYLHPAFESNVDRIRQRVFIARLRAGIRSAV